MDNHYSSGPLAGPGATGDYLIDAVEQLVHRNLAARRATLLDAARELGVHERTLQRQLKARSIVFKDLVEQVRRQRALDYLTASNLSLLQIAANLGYTEQSSFNRACNRWFATSPLAYRRRPPQPSALPGLTR